MPEGARRYIGSYIGKLAAEYPSARSALAAWRAAGGHIRTSYFNEAFRSARTQIENAPWEAGKSLRFKPSESEVLPEPHIRAHGLAQKVMIIGRLRSGEIVARPFQVPVGEQLISRAAAIRRGEEWARGLTKAGPPVGSDMVAVFGGVHIGVVRREPYVG